MRIFQKSSELIPLSVPSRFTLQSQHQSQKCKTWFDQVCQLVAKSRGGMLKQKIQTCQSSQPVVKISLVPHSYHNERKMVQQLPKGVDRNVYENFPLNNRNI